jgi:hypothetical protein
LASSRSSGSLRHNHSGTPSSGTRRSRAGTPALRKYFCAMMSTATCDQPCGTWMSAASNTTVPLVFVMRELRRSKATLA